jgi:hypothetical protein
MPLTYIEHEKISLQKDSQFNEAWLHDRICDDPRILGLGEVRVLDRERAYASAGRLDLLLFDEDNNRRYEVEVMLGATDPSHIVRTIEYWDVERRRFPGYEHVAVLIAEDITARFLNVISLLSGSVPLIAIQLNALQVTEHIVLDFVQVLDQRELRVDDTESGGDGGQTNRDYWNQKAGPALMQVCDQTLAIVNESAKTPQELNYLGGYIGLRGNGVVKNFVWFSPKPTKKIVHVGFINSNAIAWKEQFEGEGVLAKSPQKRDLRLTLTPEDFAKHNDLVRKVIIETVKEQDA